MTVLEKLKMLRSEKHFSDKDVAEILGMRLDAYLRIEHGIGRISSFLKTRLALLYDKDPEYFTDDPETEPEVEPETETEAEAEQETEIEPEEETETESEEEPEQETEIEPETDAETKAETDTEPEPETEAKTAPKEEPDAEPEPEPEPDIEDEPGPEPESLTEPEPEPVSGAGETVIPDSTAVNIEIQYAGKSVLYSDILDRVKELTGGKEDIHIYIKPEDDRVYYVSGKVSGSFGI